MAISWDKQQYDSTYFDTIESQMHDSVRGAGWPSSRKGVTLNYCRWVNVIRNEQNGEKSWYEQIADKYAEIINDPTKSIVLIGSGFAYSLEFLIDKYDFNSEKLVGVDTSPFIQSRLTLTEELDIDNAIINGGIPAWVDDPAPLSPITGRGAEIKAWLLNQYGGTWPMYLRPDLRVLNESLRNQGSINKVRNAVGGNVDWCISEFGLSSWTDSELTNNPNILNNINSIKNGTGSVLHTVAVSTNLTHPRWNGFNKKTTAEWRNFLNTNGWNSNILINGSTLEVI